MAQEEKIKEDKSSKKTKEEKPEEETKSEPEEVEEEVSETPDVTKEKDVEESGLEDDKVTDEKEEKADEGEVPEDEESPEADDENKEELSEPEEENVEENISEEFEGVEEVKEAEEKIPDFRVGDTIRVSYKIIEGDKVRTQPFQGIVISKKGSDVSKTFTVRKIGADGIGVERIFPLHSPNIEKINVVKSGKVRRAKLYYLRDRIGRKATRIKERVSKQDK
jgi:large subunit ribosomal protein L19